jgi:hypothetical protein
MPKVVPEYKVQARTRIIEQALEMFSERSQDEDHRAGSGDVLREGVLSH